MSALVGKEKSQEQSEEKIVLDSYGTFKNELFSNFSEPAAVQAMKEALAEVQSKLGKQHLLLIDGKQVRTDQWLVSINPSNPSQVIGQFAKATKQEAEQAMQAAYLAFETWKQEPAHKRAQCLFKAAEIMRKHKHELASWMILEIGKSWSEADGDVSEAIDFCEFYGREMLRLSKPQPLTPHPQEKNGLTYIPLGVGVIIPPWNFPLAILVGMSVAAIVAGNTIILKPSSETPAIAWQFAAIMEEAGLPKGVLNLIFGSGSEVGDYLVAHPKTRFIAFTGSKEVGLRINELAAKVQPGQIWLKRVIAEMGGKDSIIVDSSANLDAAADGIVASAFGFQGQKCSACSRAIVHKDVYERVLEKVIARTKELTIGPPEQQVNVLGPMSSQTAYNSILKYIEIGKKEGRLVVGGIPYKTAHQGFFLEPTIFADVDPKAKISQEEIFGPVLAFIKANSWQQALEIANNTEFGLTGSLYTKERAHMEEAAAKFHVGNLYFNRKCTGALVGVHPFGGFNMSGTDSKAGGRDYLLLFTQAKVVSEQLLLDH